jgi:hypothetical protein
MRPHRVSQALFVAGALALSPEVHAIAAPVASFGVAYQVVRDPANDPHIEGSELVFTATFAGGCATHRFLPQHRRQTMGPIVWFVHQSSDRCTQVQRQVIRLTLTQATINEGLIWLFVPSGQHLMISLRTGRVVPPGGRA